MANESKFAGLRVGIVIGIVTDAEQSAITAMCENLRAHVCREAVRLGVDGASPVECSALRVSTEFMRDVFLKTASPKSALRAARLNRLMVANPDASTSLLQEGADAMAVELLAMVERDFGIRSSAKEHEQLVATATSRLERLIHLGVFPREVDDLRRDLVDELARAMDLAAAATRPLSS